ncbi:MAG: hypothetical protein HOW97_34080 [Catenulispora sp.]|nr:hypothetical protein [Catenulispora sp.]
MTQQLTPEQLVEYRAADIGDWCQGPWTQDPVEGPAGEAGHFLVKDASGQVVAMVPHWGGSIALFIAVARDAVPALLAAFDESQEDVTGACLSLWEEEQDHRRTRTAFGSARKRAARLRARVAELEAERHSTNEALDDAVRALKDRQAEVERLRASAEGAHRRINEVLDYLATKDATKLSGDAGAMGFHIVAVLDSPPRDDEPVPVRPALPWTVVLTDLGVSDLVSELASVLLDYYRPEHTDDAVLLAKVGEVLAHHRDQAARELARVAEAGESS